MKRMISEKGRRFLEGERPREPLELTATTPRAPLGFKVSGFHGFWFHGFIQIGVGVAIAIGIDHLTTNSRDGTARVFYPQIYTDYADFFGHRSGFFGTPGGIPDFHEVSCVSRFHPNRDRDRYRNRL